MESQQREVSQPSPVILGLWPMAGITSIGVEDAESIATIHAALDAGVRWFDTAYAYGYEGRSDMVLRAALHGRHETVHVIGKVGQRWNAERQRVVDCSAATLTRDAEESLRRCGVEWFRYLLLHQPDPQVPVRESAEALARLRERGLADEIGICNATVAQLDEFACVAPVAATQFGFNMVQQTGSAEVRTWCAAHGAAGLAFWVLMKGFLAGKIARDHQFPKGDSRPKYEIFQEPMRARTHRLVDSLQEIANSARTSVAALVVAWSVRQLGVRAALVGALHPQQILETVEALRLDLSEDVVSEIERAIAVWHTT